jgi:hypothetical protein
MPALDFDATRRRILPSMADRAFQTSGPIRLTGDGSPYLDARLVLARVAM